MATKKKKKVKPTQSQEQIAIEITNKIKEAEANIVGSVYKCPELIREEVLDEKVFHNNSWRVYYEIAKKLVLTEKKSVLDEVTVGMYVEHHPNVKKVYEENNGYELVKRCSEYIKAENYEGNVNELKKWSAILELHKRGFSITQDDMSHFKDIQADEIYEEYDAVLSNIFSTVADEVVSYDVCDGIDTLIDECDDCSEIGIPFHNAELLTAEVGGFNLNGNIYGLGAGSGCVDCDTEFFTGTEWKPISKYEYGDKVLQYNEDGTAELVYPLNYIKNPRDYLWHFKTKYGLDQCLSDEHTVVYQYHLKSGKDKIGKIKFSEMKERHEKNRLGFSGGFITSFKYNNIGIDLNENWIRIMIAVFADGSYQYEKVTNSKSAIYKQVRFHLKKERKKERLEMLLNKTGVNYRKVKSATEGYDDYYFKTPFIAKHFPKEWYNCTHEQFKIIADEVMYWDGDYKSLNSYSTTNKDDADFIQFVFSALNYRASICINDRTGKKYLTNGKIYTRKSVEYEVRYTKKNVASIKGDKDNKMPINKYKTKDGYEYCFTVPSHMLILRRNNKIFITGNCGKSTMTFNYLLPSAIKYNEKIVIMINEEDKKKVQKELVIWTVNNIIQPDKPINKKTLRNGKFDAETRAAFSKAVEWIKEKASEHLITIIPLERYSARIAIKIIKKYSTAFGVRMFVLDTLKESFDASTKEIYNSMMRDMRDFYDVVKPSNRNVGLFVTYQLGKGALKMRHYTNNEIGQAKSILDVMSVNLMMRRPFDDEYFECNKALKCYKIPKKNTKDNTKLEYKLEKSKYPMITFITKNRFGETDTKQIISECDLATNTYHDVAYTNVPQDW